MRALLAVSMVLATAGSAGATGITVFLERGGMVVERDGGDQVAIPRFGGTAATWNRVVSCVREKFSPFAVEVVDVRPTTGEFITAVVGGRAELLGYDGRTVAGVGVTDTVVTRDAVVHVFSKSVGERDAQVLCQVAGHEIGHAMGLDHSMQCGDLMSYPRAECGFNNDEGFLDADAPCGEYEDRECHTGASTQNSFRRLAQLVGLRNAPADEWTSPPDTDDAWANPFGETEPEPEPTVERESCAGKHRHARRYHVRWVIILGQ